MHKSFREGRDQILRGVNIRFPHGKLTYILGPSGTGKSVTLKHILGLLAPDQGQVMVLGQDMSKLNPSSLTKFREKFGMVFQNSALFDDMTIFENVAFPLREHTDMSEKEIEAAVIGILKTLGMNGPYDKYPNEISGGMRKRVGIARAMVRKPEILLYDEPTTGLDPYTRVTVDELIEQLKNEFHLTSVVISHDIPSALRLADQIIFLDQGKVAFEGGAERFVKSNHPAIRHFLDSDIKTYQYLKMAEQK
ncbi:MAG: ATP-binding cassette domain-containing protein [Bdellovibrionales bacterium]|nr:ATP-binding cassette domain-containing protein [Bdellovibrionales bacterium]